MNPNLDLRQNPNPAGRASLGIYANTVCTPPIPKPKRIARDESVDANRKMRYQLQRAAQGLIPGERVKHCQRSTMSGSGVSVYRSDVGGASFGNLTTCGSVWHCPVCAAKITEHKRIELQDAITAWTKKGGDRSQLNEMLLFAFDIQNGDYAAQYVAKFGHEPSTKSKTITDSHWGASHELTKGHAKVGRRLGGRTAFTLLRDYIEGDSAAGELFIEYAKQFKGKRQLFWSPKLRKALALPEEEKTDEEIAADEVQEREFVTMLDHEQWRLVLSRNARFEVLRVAEDEGAAGVARLLVELAGRRYTHSDHYWERGRHGWQHLGGFIGRDAMKA